MFARKELIGKNPDVVRRFLKGYFASVAYMRAHRKESDAVAVSALKETPASASKTYQYLISAPSNNGASDPKAMHVLKQSFVDMRILKAPPSDGESRKLQARCAGRHPERRVDGGSNVVVAQTRGRQGCLQSLACSACRIHCV